MQIKQLVLAALCAIYSLNLNATAPDEPDARGGKAIVRIFTNFHTGFGTKNDYRGFELDRSYLGYEYNLGNGLTVKGIMDVGKSSDVNDYERIAYVKNAFVSWKYKKLTLHAGLIPTTQLQTQEKFWANRYIMKSNQDFYGFGSSADLGISAAYQWNDWLSTDLTLVNGEGYKKVQVEDGLLYGAGVSFTPLKGLIIRAYGSLNEASDDKGKDSYNLATFVGYKTSTYSIGCEYNRITHAKYIPDNHQQSVVVYGTAKLSKILSLYVRYDQLFVDHADYKDMEEMRLLGGIAFNIGKYIKLAPNFRFVKPERNGQKNYCMAFINCYLGI